MKKYLIITSLTGSIAVILLAFNMPEALFMLVAVGLLPGTDYTLSSSTMFFGSFTGIALIGMHIVRKPMLYFLPKPIHSLRRKIAQHTARLTAQATK